MTKKTPILIAVFSLFCAVPALAAEGLNEGKFLAMSALSDMEQQELTPLSDHELEAVEGQQANLTFEGDQLVGVNAAVNVQDVDIDIIRDVRVTDVNVICNNCP